MPDGPSWEERMRAIRETLEIAAHQSMRNSDDIAELREQGREQDLRMSELRTGIAELRTGIAELRTGIAEQKETADVLLKAVRGLLVSATSNDKRLERLERRAG